MTPEFLLTSLIIIASPGTGAIYTIAIGLSDGARMSFIAALACTLGIIPHMVAAISGLAVLLHTSAVAFNFLKYFGVVYLLYMAWGMFRARGVLSLNRHFQSGKTPRQIIISAILINVLNPKLSIFFFAFLPQFVSADSSLQFGHMIELSLVFMVLTYIVFAVYGIFAATLRQYVISSVLVQNWLRRSFAAAFAALAVQLALTHR
ncbi:LysE family translocator [Paenochrobactrum sp. BZR 588]|uniref:LysE family translocator n=1 Tax=unclassified Paenochrobactrum TaxID=2639760 RepID=UPI003852A7C2